MPLPTALVSDTVDYLATMQFATDCYLLVWGNPVVFKARVNQATFGTDFATITWDTATSGFAYADALEGYTVWLSASDDIRAAYNKSEPLRLRSVATATTLPIEYTSIQPSDNDYIFVTKDVRPSMKMPKSLALMDFNITYRDPPPTIHNLSTVYYAQIDSDGNADVDLFEPLATAIDSGASISSWAWNADGGSFIIGGTGAQDVQLRYTTPGWYMPRVTVTDNGGQTSWFTPYVFIAPNDLSSVVKLRYQDININATIDGGWNTSVPFWGGVQSVLDGTLCAVYMPHKTTGNKVLHCGRIRMEGTSYSASGKGLATFTIEGIAQQMNNLKAITWRFVNEASPSDFNHVTNLTHWRMAGRYIREMTNINNTHSLSFDDTSNDYVYLSYYLQEGTCLDSLRDQLWSINADFEFTSDGMMKLVRNARYIPTADRSALTTVAGFEFKHFTGTSKDSIMYSLELDHSKQVGKAINGIGWYNSTSGAVTVIKGITPAVLPGRGIEETATDRQILKANLSRADAETEAKQRTRNDFAAKQKQPTIRMILPAGFVGKINPSISQWYTFTITVSDGIRLITYTTSDRWLLTDLSIRHNLQFGSIILDATFQLESDDLKYSIDLQDPAPATDYSTPVLPPMSPYPTLPVLGDLTLPTGATDGDEQPIDKEDNDIIYGMSYSEIVTGDSGGNTVMVWTSGGVWMTNSFARYATNAPWTDITPSGISGTIKECVWDRTAASKVGAYVVTNNGTIGDPESIVYHNIAAGQIQTWQSTTLDDMLATQIRVTKQDECIIYGMFEQYAPAGGFPISGLTYYSGTNDMSGDGAADLLPSDHQSLSQPATEFPGVYNSGAQRFDGNTDPDGGGVGCTVKWPIPPGVRITAISMWIHYNKPITTASGQKRSSIEGDTLQFGSLTNPSPLEHEIGIAAAFNMPIEAGTQTHLYFNVAVDRKASDGAFARLIGVQISGSAVVDFAGTRHSTNKGALFAAAKSVGLMTLNSGSIDARYDQTVIAAKEEQVRKATAGSGYTNADQGATAGQYAKAIWKFGRTDDDYLLAPDAGAVGLYKIVNNVRSDISPNDGVVGFVVNHGCLAMSNKDNDSVWALMSFSGSFKLAYSTDFGDNWSFNTDPSVNANWVAVNPRRLSQVYITDGDKILYSGDGGENFAQKQGPAGNLLGVAVL